MRKLGTQYEGIQVESVNCKAAIVLQIADDYTGEFPLGGILAVIEDYKIKAVRNPSGYYIFSDLKQGTYKIHISTSYYLNEEREVTITSENKGTKLLTVKLIPNTAYPFDSGITLIRANVRDRLGNPAEGAAIKVYTLPDNNTASSIGTAASISGNVLEIKLGSTIYAAQKDNILKIGENVSEFGLFRVVECVERAGNIQKVLLDSAPDQDAAEKFVYLTAKSCIDTRANDNGEAVFYFRNIKENRFFIKLDITWKNKKFIINGSSAAECKLEVIEGREALIDIIGE